MRMFGKFLVFLNLVFSLAFLAWAIGLYSQRLDWVERLKQLDEQIVKLIEERNLTERRWQTDSELVPTEEKRRYDYLAWYEEQLDTLQTGKDKKGENVEAPVRGLVRDKDNLLIMDPNAKGREPVKITGFSQEGKPVELILKSNDYYVDEIRVAQARIDALQKEINALVKEGEDLTNEIAGIPGKTRGLRGKYEDQINYKKLFDDEMKVLTPMKTARQIDIEQQKRRLESLVARLKELQAAGIAARLP